MPAAPIPTNETGRLESLHQSGHLDTPIEERFERITRLACRALNTPIAGISLIDRDRQWFKSIQGLPVRETPREQAFCGFTILDDKPLVVRDARADDRFSDNPLVYNDPNIVFYAGYPVRASDGSRIGSLCVIDRKPHQPSHEDLQLLRDLAALAESELARSMQDSVQRELLGQCDELARAARIDSLTRVWNHQAIHEVLDNRLALLRRDMPAETPDGMHDGMYDEPDDYAAVIMADLDHFKQINDEHGHVLGDEILRQATTRMLGAIRQTDAVGRYGGEEFMIVLGRCRSREEAQTVAERVRARIAEGPFVTEEGQFAVTISLGVALCENPACMAADDLIHRADDALYEAKEAGRNRVHFAACDATDSDAEATEPFTAPSA